MTDYEHSLWAAIKSNLPETKIRFCYFHYSKAIYKKAKFYNLFSKKNRKISTIICFILKLFPYIPTNLRNDYLKIIEDFIKDFDKRYKKLLSYFKRNWVNNKFFKFREISDDEIIKRTNNICESYNRYLNNTISHYHPKIGYLIIKLKEYAFNTYKKWRESLIRKINVNIEKALIYHLKYLNLLQNIKTY